MSDDLGRTARRIKRDLDKIVAVWRKERMEQVVNTPLSPPEQVIDLLREYHAVGEFIEYVEQLIREAETDL